MRLLVKNETVNELGKNAKLKELEDYKYEHNKDETQSKDDRTVKENR